VTADYPNQFPGVEPSLVVIEKVRHGRFFNIGGDMPLFSQEALSDEDLGALLAYLEL
jgi:thiosulfate dehydrogenase